MPLSVTDPEVERLTEELARRHGISKTEVIRQALRHEAAREGTAPAPDGAGNGDESPSAFVERIRVFTRELRLKGNPAHGLPADKAWIDSLYE